MVIEIVGALPEEWQNSYYDKDNPLKANPCEKHRWFDDQIQRAPILDTQILKQMPELSPNEQDTFLQLLKAF